MTETSLFEEMDALANRAATEIIVVLENERADIDAKIKRIKAYQKALLPPAHKSKRGSGKNGSSPSGKRLERIKLLAEFIGNNYAIDESFTAIALHERMNPEWSPASTNQCLQYLRTAEVIGKSGLEPLTRRQQWSLMDNYLSALESAGL